MVQAVRYARDTFPPFGGPFYQISVKSPSRTFFVVVTLLHKPTAQEIPRRRCALPLVARCLTNRRDLRGS
jgi:hypothetical protein